MIEEFLWIFCGFWLGIAFSEFRGGRLGQ